MRNNDVPVITKNRWLINKEFIAKKSLYDSRKFQEFTGKLDTRKILSVRLFSLCKKLWKNLHYKFIPQWQMRITQIHGNVSYLRMAIFRTHFFLLGLFSFCVCGKIERIPNQLERFVTVKVCAHNSHKLLDLIIKKRISSVGNSRGNYP